jgi:ATP-dependent RNA helicase DDX31/DBP7
LQFPWDGRKIFRENLLKHILARARQSRAHNQSIVFFPLSLDHHIAFSHTTVVSGTCPLFFQIIPHKYNITTAMTAEGFDLNIVAIPAPQQPVTTKRIKKNKYEKRRQKAKKAQQQLQEGRQQRENVVEDIDLSKSPPSREEETNVVKVDEKASGDKIMRDKKSLPEGKEKPEVEKDGKDATNTVSKANGAAKTFVKSTPLEQQPQSKPAPAATAASPAPSVHAATEKSRKETVSLQDDEERARYMAEYHARPMELDRRAGARKVTLVSKESKHIFDSDSASNDWQSLGIHSRLIQTLQSSHFGNLEKPTTIQARTMRAFHGKDMQSTTSKTKHNVLIHSETGSGKTLAYMLPILQSLAYGDDFDPQNHQQPPNRVSRSQLGCRCIILCPTRELANQTLQVAERLCQANFAGWIVPGGLLGGDSRSSEKSRLRKGLAMIVATPGRLLDHLTKTQSLALSLKGKFQWLVLDEADRLLDMGLGDQVRQIVQWIRANEASKQLNKQSHTWWRSVLVSATVTPSVQALAKERMLCGDQEWVWVKGDNGSNSTSSNANSTDAKDETETSENYSNSTPRQLAQFHLTVTAKLRLSALVAFLVQRISKGERTVVFMGTCASVDYHYELFRAIEQSLWDGEDGEKDDAESTKTPVGLFGKKARVFKLHGNVAHAKRVQTMKEFTNSKSKSEQGASILLTTDVAARGLNLDDIDWTVQYDPPCEISDYVHRVGRGARAGKAGHSLLFLLPSERKYLDVLDAKGINNLTPLSLSSTLNQAAALCSEWTQAGVEQGGGGSGKKFQSSSGTMKSSRSGEFFSIEVQKRLEDCVVEDDVQTRKAWKEKQQLQKKRKQNKVSSKDGRKEGQLLSMARDAFLSFLRAYPTKKEPIVRSIFSSRALHLGHVAKSFALKEPPTSVVSKNKSKKQQQQEEAEDIQANLPKSLEFGQAPGDLDDLLSQVETNRNRILDDDDESDDEDFRSKKRQKLQQNGKSMNAKALLLANAVKMQNNLMDAM